MSEGYRSGSAVEGNTPAGNAVKGNPLQCGGVDGSGNAQPLPVNPTPGYSADVDDTFVTIKATPGTLVGLHLENTNTGEMYVNVYNAVTPVLGTTVPLQSFAVPPVASGVSGKRDLVLGSYWSTAITISATTTAGGAVAPTNALTANWEVV